ncbi:MAG TPA: MBL fold metallo-hydrolase [Vicinamibacterales bacterium]|nr:MBL fold metallo-hydrolase [Vicinamibacterales bacterium]
MTGPAAAESALTIYFVDVEGGQSTLVVTPAGESLLVDAGFPGDGTFNSQPGDPSTSRDARRIAAVAREAGIKQIDYLLITHFHGDHDGGVGELSKLLPIRTFVDHDTVPPEAETVAGTLDLFQRYAAVRAKGRHIVPKPGGRLPLKGVEATIVSSGREVLTKSLAGAGSANASCSAPPPAEQEIIENPRSTGLLLRFGRFRFLDIGDLVAGPLRALFCPVDRIGPVDAYLVTHHGNADAADAATFAALKPRTAIVNNGATKGGAPALLAMMQDLKIDGWQLHRSTNAASRNVETARIANLDETTANWIRLDANGNGSFAVTNARTREMRRYPSVRH